MFDLKAFREKHNLTQKDISELVHVSPQAVINAEKGRMKIPGTWIEALIDKYGIAVNNFIEAGDSHKTLPVIKSDPNGKQIPFYDQQVFATISPAMGDVVALRPDTFIKIPMFSQGEFAVQVTGHSMKPYISHGDWIVIKQITNREAIIYGEPYLVITKSDNLKTVKFLKAGDEPDCFWLVPYNVEQFEPQEIKKKEVLELYRVVGLFRTV